MIWTCQCGCRVDDPSNGASGRTCAECMARGGPVAVAPSGLDLDSLEANARAATPGPWTYIHVLGVRNRTATFEPTNWDGEAQADNDCKFIAAVSPDVVLALVTAIRRGAFYEEAHKAAHASQRRFRDALDAIALNGSDPACVRTAEEALEADDRARGVE